MKSAKTFLIMAIVAFCGLAISLQGAVEVGVVQDFSATPDTNDWATGFIDGAGNTLESREAVDAAVQVLSADMVAATLPTSGTFPPSTFGTGFRRNTTTNALQSRPTGEAAILLKATLSNSTPDTLTTVDITYLRDFINPGNVTESTLIGHEVYYSMDGQAGTWIKIEALSWNASIGPVGATLDLSTTPWLSGATMYILWVDDNHDGFTDPAYIIDNFLVQQSGSSPTITLDPVEQTVEQCRTATFTAEAVGSPPLSFQWYKDNFPIDPGFNPSAVTLTLVISNVQSSDAGSYHMVVSNPFGSDPSDPAQLIYQPDTTPPTVTSAVFDPLNLQRLVITLSEPVHINAGTDPFQWQILGDPPVAVENLNFLNAEQTQVEILFTPARTVGAAYTLENSTDLTDLCTEINALPAGTLFDIVNPGLAFRQDVNGYTGTHDAEIHENAPDQNFGAAALFGVDNADPAPFRSRSLLRFADVFGSGLTQVPFGSEISNATLTVTTADPGSNPVMIFRMLVGWDEDTVTWNSLGNGIDDGTNGTEAVFFGTVNPTPDEAADDIDVTALVQEWANGADNYGWAFVATGTDGWDVYSSESGNLALRPTLLVEFVQSTEPCEILDQPNPVTVDEGQSFSLTVAASGAGLSYQWFRNDVAIAGANGSSYSVGAARPGEHAGTYHVQVNDTIDPNSPCVSADAVVTVNADTAGPTVVSALGTTDQNVITITFSDQNPLNATDAQNTANYIVSGGVSVNSATLDASGRVVTLNTTARAPGQNYSLTIQNIHDTAEANNLLSPNPTVISTLRQEVLLLARNAPWKYLNDGSNLDAVNWTEGAYDDSAWPSAETLLGYEDSAGTHTALFNQGWNTNNLTLLVRVNTTGGGLNGTNITDFFRASVNIPFSLDGAVIAIRHVIDDGGVFYFNGSEVARFNMPTGPVGYLTEALGTMTEGVTRTIAGLTGLATGNNTIAVSVHQNVHTSSDIVFGAELLAVYGATPPTLTIVNNGDGTVTISWSPSGGTLQQSTDLTNWVPAASQANPQTITAAGLLFFRVAP